MKRTFLFGLIFILSFITPAYCQSYIAFSLKKAEEMIQKGKKDPIIYSLAHITDIKGVIYDRGKRDIIIFGISDPSLPEITLNEFIIALRSIFIHGRKPSVILNPGDKVLTVSFEGGVGNTRIGRILLDHALRLKNTHPSHNALLLCFIPEISKGKDLAVINGFEEILILDGKKKESPSFSPDLKIFSQLIAISEAIEQLNVAKSELFFWLNQFRPSYISISKKINAASKTSYEIKIFGRAYLRKENLKRLKKEILKKREKKLFWYVNIEKSEKEKSFSKEEEKGISLLSEAIFLTNMEKSYYKAIDVYTDIIKILPKWDIPYYMRGCIHSELGHFNEAIKDFNNAIKLNHRYLMAYVNKGYTYNYIGIHKKALNALNKAIEISPYNIDAYNNRGIAFCGLKKYERGILDFDNVTKIVPNFFLAYVNKGKAYFCLGKYNKAIAELNKAINLSSSLAEAYCSRGIAYRYLGEYKKAIDDFKKAIRLRPYYAYAYLQLGITYERLCQWDEANKNVEKAISLNPRIFTLYVSSVIKLTPKTAEEYYEHGYAYFCMGKWKKAIKDFDKVIKLKPSFAASYFYRGLSYDNIGYYKEAIKDYSKAIELVPKDPVLYNNRGTAYYFLRDYENALKDFNKAIELNPKKAVFYENRVRVYLRLSKNKEACKDSKTACTLGKCKLYYLLMKKGICK